MLFIDTEYYQVLRLKTHDNKWVYPPDCFQKIYEDIGIMIDDLMILKVRGKFVYICSKKCKFKLSNKYKEYKWCSEEEDICGNVKSIFK